MDTRCKEIDSIISDINEKTKELYKDTLEKEKLTVFSADYSALSKIINDSIAEKQAENAENRELTEKALIAMGKYKSDKSWTLNSGFLLRYGLLTHKVNFVGTLKNFRDSDSFRKLWEITQGRLVNDDGEIIPITDPLLKDAQEYIQLAVDNLIATSQDGVIITPESREEARKLTLKMWGQK